jgi:hypothetical protein
MILQQPESMTISTYLPDAPLSIKEYQHVGLRSVPLVSESLP